MSKMHPILDVIMLLIFIKSVFLKKLSKLCWIILISISA